MNDRMQTGFRRWKACPQGEGLCQECRECKEWEEWECPPRDRVLELVHMRAHMGVQGAVHVTQTRTLHPFTRLCSTERTRSLCGHRSLNAACCLLSTAVFVFSSLWHSALSLTAIFTLTILGLSAFTFHVFSYLGFIFIIFYV